MEEFSVQYGQYFEIKPSNGNMPNAYLQQFELAVNNYYHC